MGNTVTVIESATVPANEVGQLTVELRLGDPRDPDMAGEPYAFVDAHKMLRR